MSCLVVALAMWLLATAFAVDSADVERVAALPAATRCAIAQRVAWGMGTLATYGVKAPPQEMSPHTLLTEDQWLISTSESCGPIELADLRHGSRVTVSIVGPEKPFLHEAPWKAEGWNAPYLCADLHEMRQDGAAIELVFVWEGSWLPTRSGSVILGIRQCPVID